MAKTYLVCKKCGKKGMSRNISRHYASYECKYCGVQNTIGRFHLWGLFTTSTKSWTDEEYNKAKEYMEANGYIDKENRYSILWDDKKQGF